MACNTKLLLMNLLLLLPSAFSATLFLPVIKTTDHARPQYHTKLQIGTSRVPIVLTLDVNNNFSWLTCDAVGYNHSSTYTSIPTHTPDCKSFTDDGVSVDCDDTSVPTPYCNHNQCATGIINPITGVIDLGRLVFDSVTLFRRIDPSSAPVLTSVLNYPLACSGGRPEILTGLSKLSNGILSLSTARAPIAFQYRVSSSFNVPRRFSVCLPSSTASNGAVYFGGGPYSVTKSMASLPLVVDNINNPSLGEKPSLQYYIKLTSIEIDGSPVVFNSSFLSFDVNGNNGVLVSTIASYGQLRSEIYKPFLELYVTKALARNMKTVASPRKEFGACFDPNSIKYDPKTGSGLPIVDLVSDGNKRWRIFGSNSVVEVRGASCLAFVEGKPLKPKAIAEVFPAVVIGGVQMEDNLVEFDAAKSRLGVSSSLLRLGTSCSKFKGV